ncbi:ribosomal subunit interface protein [Weissella uvarum]|uniref:ribosome hibernation-promoting factor, HPF/YfiA family n=1 Tax=Weissella uvarum TaxID=1479233 RepID=UPI001961E312|nr:ribosome-associated translation inhibitor RaiA [Weissella uvarum]MBM7617944.1 ribosomal subunit interface protein [Weissella uvarum]MCM0596163.1 ribosome-associated translation inhibitor RaiA [Weissella uvarum]
MLDYQIRGLNFDVTEAIQAYVEKRMARLEKYLDDAESYPVRVKLGGHKSDRTYQAEVTVQLPELVLRAEDTEDDLYAAIDMVVDKLERQIKKYKTKINRKLRKQGIPDLNEVESDVDQAENTDELPIVRKKTVELKPMDPQEAVLQMELLGHDFFIFLNAENELPAVVYKRKDGQYALLDTDN